MKQYCKRVLFCFKTFPQLCTLNQAGQIGEKYFWLNLNIEQKRFDESQNIELT